MISLSSIDLIIPCRISESDRRENFIAVISYIIKNYNEFRLIIVEMDERSIVNSCLPAFPDTNIISVFVRNTGRFSRARCLNLGVRVATAPILCFHDADMVADATQMIEAIRVLRDTNISDVRYPHRGCINVSGALKQRFCQTLDASLFDGIDAGHLTEDSHILYGNIASGVVFYRRHQFIDVGGFNEEFVGWGGEDDELLLRTRSLGLKHHTVETSLFHLHHGPAEPSMPLESRFKESVESGTRSLIEQAHQRSADDFAELAKRLRRQQFGVA